MRGASGKSQSGLCGAGAGAGTDADADAEPGTSAGAGTPVSTVSGITFAGGFLRGKGARRGSPGTVGATVTPSGSVDLGGLLGRLSSGVTPYGRWGMASDSAADFDCAKLWFPKIASAAMATIKAAGNTLGG